MSKNESSSVNLLFEVSLANSQVILDSLLRILFLNGDFITSQIIFYQIISCTASLTSSSFEFWIPQLRYPSIFLSYLEIELKFFND